MRILAHILLKRIRRWKIRLSFLSVFRSISFFALLLSSHALLIGQTLEEKLASYQGEKEKKGDERSFSELNRDLSKLRKQLRETYQLVGDYHERSEKEEEFHKLLVEVNAMRTKIADLEQEWRDLAVDDVKKTGEGYAFWDEEEITLSHLIMEYGSSDYLYVIPPEILNKKVHLHSGIPVPRESWTDLLEIILFHNGVGIDKVNPYARRLYLLKQDLVAVEQILNRREDLALVANHNRVAYIFSPSPERIKGATHFFNRFRDQKNAFVYQVGTKLVLVASKEEVEKLLTLHDAIWEKEGGKVAEIVSMSRLSPKEMESILRAYFDGGGKKVRIGRNKGAADELVLIPLKDQGSLVLIGPKELVAKAKKIVKKSEEQIEDPMEMTVYWYTCRHSDPIEVCEALEKVYAALIYSGIEGETPHPSKNPLPPTRSLKPGKKSPLNPPEYGPPPYSPVVQPFTILPTTAENQKRRSYTTNFVPYPKTGSIMMVVRRDTLGKLKELLRKIDVPKKMVRIEVLFFEKTMDNTSRSGLNMLKWGSEASNVRKSGASYAQETKPESGIVKFLIQRKNKSFWGTFDIAYNFLLSQQDIRINSAPSTITLNQTPAEISIKEEISINNGAVPVDNANLAGVAIKESFSRAEYGINLVVTPTVHDPVEGEGMPHSVTLETDINFDTFSTALDANEGKPNVMRRQVKNWVRVIDGETVILGGLRQKNAEDSNNKLPFLGELPGIGKLFGNSRMIDKETEMFIFITPKVVFDAEEDVERNRREQLLKRPGDLPEFLERIEEGKRAMKRRLFDKSLNLIFGNIRD